MACRLRASQAFIDVEGNLVGGQCARGVNAASVASQEFILAG
jgi:hypothetical protein